MSALEEGRFGQDFVFTVPVLEAAVDYAVDTAPRRPTTAAGRAGSWWSSAPRLCSSAPTGTCTEPA